jgi:hypothetical protein
MSDDQAMSDKTTLPPLHELLRCRLCDALMYGVIFGWGALAGVFLHG